MKKLTGTLYIDECTYGVEQIMHRMLCKLYDISKLFYCPFIRNATEVKRDYNNFSTRNARASMLVTRSDNISFTDFEQALKTSGGWLVFDLKGTPTPAENIKAPEGYGATLYGFSMMVNYCECSPCCEFPPQQGN